MRAAFDRVSMTVGVSGDRIPFDYEQALHPTTGGPEIRRWFHELLHLWQLFGSGFLANLACNQLDAVVGDEGQSAIGQTDLLEAFARKDDISGYSALDLHESLARYWDIHVMSPVRILRDYAEDGMDVDGALARLGLTWNDLEGAPEVDQISSGLFWIDSPDTMTVRPYTGRAFDLAMMIEPTYTESYRRMLAIFGSLESVIYFPLIGHFALQTRRPERMFSAMVGELSSSDIRSVLEGKRDIHEMWRAAYPYLAELAWRMAPAYGGSALTPGWQVLIQRAENRPVLRHYADLTRLALQLHGSLLDVALALPGDPQFRQMLASYYLPAATVFDNGSTCEASSMTKYVLVARTFGNTAFFGSPGVEEIADQLSGVLAADDLARKALDLRQRSAANRSTDFLISHGVTPGTPPIG